MIPIQKKKRSKKVLKLFKSGQVKAAALDVLAKEPFDLSSSPLRDAPNLTITPHSSWYSDQSLKVRIECNNYVDLFPIGKAR